MGKEDLGERAPLALMTVVLGSNASGVAGPTDPRGVLS